VVRRVAIIGLGMAVGPHVESLLALQDRVTIAAAYSPSAERRGAFHARFPSVPPADDLAALLSDRSIDAVSILTPPNTHLELVRRAAAAGKHILLEKPLETTVARAEQVVAACSAAGVALGVVLQHRFRPSAQRLRGILAEGSLGRLVGCSTAMRLWRPQSYYDQPGRGTLARDGGGVLLTQGIHTLDLMLSLAGPVAEVAAFATTTPVHRMETEDLVAAALRFANGALGPVDATTAAYPGSPERIELVFERGSAAIAGTALQVWWQDGRAESFGADGSSGSTGADPMAFPPDYHRALIADWLAALDEGRAPVAGGAEGLAVQRLIEAILGAAADGRARRLET
jgi:predicted dehydrogenase